jgi:hypothetical protein
MKERAPDMIGPLRAWRSWYVRETEEGWRLFSIHYGEAWPAERAIEAACYRSRYVSNANENTHARHAAPARDCLCGVYGAKELDQARQYFVASYSGCEMVPVTPDYVHRVVGQVDLWGRVIDCSQGYRAEIAYPAHLWLPTRRPDGKDFDVEAAALDLLAYGVPVELLDGGSRFEIMRRLSSLAPAAET